MALVTNQQISLIFSQASQNTGTSWNPAQQQQTEDIDCAVIFFFFSWSNIHKLQGDRLTGWILGAFWAPTET